MCDSDSLRRPFAKLNKDSDQDWMREQTLAWNEVMRIMEEDDAFINLLSVPLSNTQNKICEIMLENILRECTARLNGVVIRERLLRIMLRLMYQRIADEEQSNTDHEEDKENIKPTVPE